MQDIVTLRGFVATDPVIRHTASGAAVTGFRLASTERRFDRDAKTWVDAHTNWYSVSAFGLLGANTAQSVKKGNPVILTGRLRIRDWAAGERAGTSVDVVADAVGLDLGFGAVAFARTHRIAAATERNEGAGGFPAALPDAFADGEEPTRHEERPDGALGPEREHPSGEAPGHPAAGDDPGARCEELDGSTFGEAAEAAAAEPLPA